MREPHFAPQDATNKKNLRLLIQLRWLAVFGQIVTIVIAHGWLGIALPIGAMSLVILLLVALNAVSQIRLANAEIVTHGELFVQLLLDVAALSTQLYFSGGASNPFIFLYLLQVMLGTVLLDFASVWVLVLITGGCFIWLMIVNRPMATGAAGIEMLFRLHMEGMFVCFVLTAALLVVYVGQVHRNLQARDAHLAQLRQRYAEEELLVHMGLLTTGAAHELGTPLSTLSVILGDWQTMPAIQADPDLARELGEMQEELARCKAIVSGILMSSGEMRGEGTVRTTIRGFLDDIVAEWRTSRSPRFVDYRNMFNPDEAIVSDLGLRQVIFNVFDNALEASPDWVGISLVKQGEEAVIYVTDRGPGFAADVLADFGKPYRSTKKRRGGGLGLFLVVNVLRKLGGRASATNLPEGGARVALTLPLAALSPGGRDVG